MKQIALTQGKFALVDDADFEWLNQYKWFVYKGGNTFYAARQIRIKKGRDGQRMIIMHREIMGLGNGDKRQCDHRNHNGLDNRRDNFRICTRAQNQHNRNPNKNGSSAFRGVFWDKWNHKWRARIQVDGHVIHLGYFASEVDAAYEYDKAARKHFVQFANTNF